MATQLTTFVESEIRVVRKEDLLTEGLNRKEAVTTPRGVYRGFRLDQSVVNNIVDVEADTDTSDHVLVYETNDGFSLRVRRTGGDFTLDFSGLVVDTEYIVAVFATYTTTAITSAEIRAYTLAEYNAAPEKDELVILGTGLTGNPVPGSLVTPASNRRTLAWHHVAPDALRWEQLINDGSFEALGPLPLDEDANIPGWLTLGVNNTDFYAAFVDGPAHTGTRELGISGTGSSGSFQLIMDSAVRVEPGQLLDVSFWLRGVLWGGVGGAGTPMQGVFLTFLQEDLSTPAGSNISITDNSLVGTFAWTETAQFVEVPANAQWMFLVILVASSNPVTGSLYIDDLSVWAQCPHDPKDLRMTRRGAVADPSKIHASTFLGKIFPTGNLSDVLTHLIQQTHKGTNSNTEEVWEARVQGGDRLLLELARGALKINRIDNAVEAAEPKITVPYPGSPTAFFTLVVKMENAGQSVRLYATPGATGGLFGAGTYGYVMTVNAGWDASASKWVPDDVTEHAHRFDFNALGIYLHRKDSGVANWGDADWADNATDGTRYWAVHRYADGQCKVPIQGITELLMPAAADQTDTILETPRLLLENGDTSVAFMTNLIEAASTALSRQKARLYSRLLGAGGVAKFMMVLNGKWDESGSHYDLDVIGEPIAEIEFPNTGEFAVYANPGPVDPVPAVNMAEMFKLDLDYTPVECTVRVVDGAIEFFDASATARSNRSVPGAQNILCAANVPKAWGRIRCGNGAASIIEEYGVAARSYASTGPTITLDAALDTNTYVIVFGVTSDGLICLGSQTVLTNSFQIRARNVNTGAQIDFSNPTEYDLQFVLFGRQS